MKIDVYNLLDDMRASHPSRNIYFMDDVSILTNSRTVDREVLQFSGEVQGSTDPVRICRSKREGSFLGKNVHVQHIRGSKIPYTSSMTG